MADQIPESTKMEVARTSRGFAVARGVDRYAAPYSIQDSSLAEEAAIWLGSDADTGGRAHLTQDMAAGLIPLLQAFVATGSIAGCADTIAAPPAIDRETVEKALTSCRDQFAFYAREHTAAGKSEKAATNERFAKIADDALSTLSADAIRQGEGKVREWPDIGDDPMKSRPYEDRMAVSADAIRKAYTVQQPIVPDQTALVWRWHLGALLEAEIRLRSILADEPATPAPAVDAKARADMAAALRNTPAEALREAGYLERAAQMIEAPAVDAVPAGEVRAKASGWRKNAAGFKDGAECYRTIGGVRWPWWAEDAAIFKRAGIRHRRAPGGDGTFIHPHDSEKAFKVADSRAALSHGEGRK